MYDGLQSTAANKLSEMSVQSANDDDAVSPAIQPNVSANESSQPSIKSSKQLQITISCR